jgi:hypothetical protein
MLHVYHLLTKIVNEYYGQHPDDINVDMLTQNRICYQNLEKKQKTQCRNIAGVL